MFRMFKAMKNLYTKGTQRHSLKAAYILGFTQFLKIYRSNILTFILFLHLLIQMMERKMGIITTSGQPLPARRHRGA